MVTFSITTLLAFKLAHRHTGNEYYNIGQHIQLISLSELKEAFDIFDKNNDGTISPNEVKDILKALELCSTEEQVSKMMKEADIDGQSH